MRAVLDTNVVMSAIFFGGTPMKIVRAAFSKKVQLVASRAVMSEYREVAERLHEQFPSVNYRRPLSILESKLTMVPPLHSVKQSVAIPMTTQSYLAHLEARRK